MTEQLYIRLGSRAEQTIHWLIYAPQPQEVIASGLLNHADDLAELASKAEHRRVVVLVPGSDVSLHQLNMPIRGKRQAMAAMPFMLEEQLADQVEATHFSVYDRVGEQWQVMTVAKQRMHDWLEWLQSADIHPEQLLPDTLAFPTSSYFQALQLGDEWLLHAPSGKGMTCDADHLAMWLPLFVQSAAGAETNEESPGSETASANQLLSYTPWPELAVADLDVTVELAELPLLPLALAANSSHANLLEGEFKRKRNQQNWLYPWRYVVVLVIAVFVTYLSATGAQWWRLQQEITQVEQQIVHAYKQAFPRERNVRPAMVQVQMRSKLKKLAIGPAQSGFGNMFVAMETAFETIPTLKMQSLRFDAKRNEIRLQARAKSFDDFERFKQQLSQAEFKVELGALNASGDDIRGSVTLRKSS